MNSTSGVSLAIPPKDKIDAISEMVGVLKAASDQDIETAMDWSKYATWLAAFATPGIALILTEVRRVVEKHLPLSPYVLVAGCMFAIVCVLAAVIFRLTNRRLRINRNVASMVAVQTVVLKTNDDAFKPTEPSDYLALPEKICAGEFLARKDAPALVTTRKEDAKLVKWVRCGIGAQEVLLLLAYALVLSVMFS